VRANRNKRTTWWSRVITGQQGGDKGDRLCVELRRQLRLRAVGAVQAIAWSIHRRSCIHEIETSTKSSAAKYFADVDAKAAGGDDGRIRRWGRRLGGSQGGGRELSRRRRLKAANAFLIEQLRLLNERAAPVKAPLLIGDSGKVISAAEAQMMVCLQHGADVCELTAVDFSSRHYGRHHNWPGLSRAGSEPQPFCYSVRRSTQHSPEGQAGGSMSEPVSPW
jgi:hypothetical protein